MQEANASLEKQVKMVVDELKGKAEPPEIHWQDPDADQIQGKMKESKGSGSTDG